MLDFAEKNDISNSELKQLDAILYAIESADSREGIVRIAEYAVTYEQNVWTIYVDQFEAPRDLPIGLLRIPESELAPADRTVDLETAKYVLSLAMDEWDWNEQQAFA